MQGMAPGLFKKRATTQTPTTTLSSRWPP